MNPWLLLALGLGAIALAVAWPRWRLRRALETPFPEAWKTILAQNSAYYSRLPDALVERLHGRIQRFLHEKHFQGAGGLEVDDEIRVTIAAEACLLTLGRGPAPNVPGDAGCLDSGDVAEHFGQSCNNVCVLPGL